MYTRLSFSGLVLLASLFNVLAVCPSAYSAAWFVDKDNVSGVEDGTTWTTAFDTIQEGIDAAFNAGGGEVWVARGVYDEPRTSIRFGVNTGSLLMKDGVGLYGGFLGAELSRIERAAGVYSTIDGSMSANGSNANSVVVAADQVTLDGFVITGGCACNDPWTWTAGVFGGGMFVEDESVTVSNCIFQGNRAIVQGGGLYNAHGSVNVSRCVFVGNAAGSTTWGAHGGGLSGTAQLSNCIFQDNEASNWGGAVSGAGSITGCTFIRNSAPTSEGGAIWIWAGPTAITNCKFISNTAILGAAAVISDVVDFTNCLFAGNMAEQKGAIETRENSSVRAVNCTFVQNTALEGSVVSMFPSSWLSISNCIVWNNSDTPLSLGATAAATVTYSDFQGDCPGEGNVNLEPEFVDAAGNDFRLLYGSPCIDAGTSENAPDSDILGVFRPQYNGVDMGAYEFIVGDEDGDGMDDRWEQDNGLDPTDSTDGVADADGDGLDNVHEFLSESDPQDPADPPVAVYVSPLGNDTDGDGTGTSPWATIGRAMARVAAYAAYRATTVYMAEGVYQERVVFSPNVTLTGAGPGVTKVEYYSLSDAEHVVVEGAQGAALRDCTVALPGFYTTSTVLLRIEDVAMEISNVVFDGNDNLYSLGAMITGVNSSDSTIVDSTFRRLHFAIQAVNSGVNVTHTKFEGIRGDAVFVRLPDKSRKGDATETPVLGDASQVDRTGFNVFRNVFGCLVMNMSYSQTLAENNDWGVYTKSQIGAKMLGAVDYEPFVAGAEGEGEGEGEGQCPPMCGGMSGSQGPGARGAMLVLGSVPLILALYGARKRAHAKAGAVQTVILL